jgi:hypothetical protein
VRSALLIGVAVLGLGPLGLAACSSGHPAAGPTPTSSYTATRWWSNSMVKLGSVIDPAHPRAGAAHLHSSRAEYCTMLSQTLHNSGSVLPGISATDPALLTSTTAFVAEIQAVAPGEVSAAWKLLGDALVALVKTGGNPTLASGVTGPQVNAASATITADARSGCGLDLNGAASASPSASR